MNLTCPICRRDYCDHTPAQRLAADPNDEFAKSSLAPRGPNKDAYEYAGFKYRMTTDETGKATNAWPVDGQHPAAQKGTHHRAAVENFNTEHEFAKNGHVLGEYDDMPVCTECMCQLGSPVGKQPCKGPVNKR